MRVEYDFDWADYYEYLRDMAKADKYEDVSYDLLLEQLYRTDFRYQIPKDLNRAKDGKNLRLTYADEVFEGFYNEDDILQPNCSVLEMMLALSKRIEVDIMGVPGEDDPSKWFWLMIDNLGLLDFTDDSYNMNEVEHILDRWMTRQIKTNGSGGLFPLDSPKRSQRRLEIWFQMADYLEEKFPFV